MKFIACILLILGNLIGLSAIGKCPSDVNPDKSEPEIWENEGDIYTASYRNHTFKVDVGLSGRVISYQLNNIEILAQSDVHPFYFGSTFWPGPQKKWNGPIYPVLDGDSYTAFISGDTLKTESKNSISTFVNVRTEKCMIYSILLLCR